MMTIGQAAGELLAAYIDDTKIDFLRRREIMLTLPPECRFIDPEGRIQNLSTIQAIFDWKASNGTSEG